MTHFLSIAGSSMSFLSGSFLKVVAPTCIPCLIVEVKYFANLYNLEG